MQEKTLEEEFEDKFSGLWLDGMHNYNEDKSYGEKETKEKLLSFISSREEKAREEGRKEGMKIATDIKDIESKFNDGVDVKIIQFEEIYYMEDEIPKVIKERMPNIIESFITQYKEELLGKINKLYQDERPVDCIDGETPVETYGYEVIHNNALSEIKKLL